MNNIKTTAKKKGAVLLIAILVSSVALAVGLGVYNRTYKEALFASFWKHTQVAFLAADAGLECALYWELNPGAGGPGTASCFGAAIPAWDPLVQTGSFQIDVVSGTGPCVNIVIAYEAALLATTTTARGYNVSCANLTAGTVSRIVERGLKVGLQ